MYITDNYNTDRYHHYIYIFNISIIDNIDQNINEETRIIDDILANIMVKHKRCHQHRHQLRPHGQQAEANISNNISNNISRDQTNNNTPPSQHLYREHQRETAKEGREHLQRGHPKQGCNNPNINKNNKKGIALDNKIEIEKHIKQRIAHNIIMINILEVNGINKDEREGHQHRCPRSGHQAHWDEHHHHHHHHHHHCTAQQDPQPQERAEDREAHHRHQRDRDQHQDLQNRHHYLQDEIRIQDNESIIVIEDSSHSHRLDRLEAAFYHDCILGLESFLVINDHNLIIIDHNTLRSFTNIKRALKTNIYIKYCNLDILIYDWHLTTQVDILEDDIYISITIITNIVVITGEKIGLDNFISRIDFKENLHQEGAVRRKDDGHLQRAFCSHPLALCHNQDSKDLSLHLPCHRHQQHLLSHQHHQELTQLQCCYIVYIEQHYHNIVIYIIIIIIIIIIVVIVNYKLPWTSICPWTSSTLLTSFSTSLSTSFSAAASSRR